MEIKKWQKFGKSDEEIEIIIDRAKNKGERYRDANNNGKYDPGEIFSDGNNQYNKGVKSYWLLIHNSSHNLTPHNSEGLVIFSFEVIFR